MPHLKGDTTTAYPYVTCGSFWGTLPRDLAKHPPVEIWFSTFPPQTNALLCERAQAMLRDKTVPEAVVDAFYDTIAGDPHRWLTSPDDVPTVSEMWIRAVGHRQGRAARYTCWFTAPMWDVNGYYLTSVALVVAALKILRGEVEKRGVMTAESIFDPLPFLDEVASLLPNLEGKMIDGSLEWLG